MKLSFDKLKYSYHDEEGHKGKEGEHLELEHVASADAFASPKYIALPHAVVVELRNAHVTVHTSN